MKKQVFLVSLLGLFLFSCGGGEKPTPDPKTIERTVSFNIPGCKMYYGGTEITSGGTKIEIPIASPYYAKFSIKTNDDNYKKLSEVTLDKVTDYTFYKEYGDLYINLQSDIAVTGICGTYKTLEECAWAGISAASKDGVADEIYKVGQTKTVMVNNQPHEVRIIGFNKDKDIDGNDIGITFEFANVITNSDGNADTTYWNIKDDDASTNYKYSDSTLNDYLNVGENCIFNKLPDDLKADGIIKEVYKPVAEAEEPQSGEDPIYEISDTYTTKLFPLSYREITASGKSDNVKEEGSAYPFYTGEGYDTKDNRIKKRANASSEEEGQYYWLRSPHINNNVGAYYSTPNGILGSNVIYSRLIPVAPAFCI